MKLLGTLWGSASHFLSGSIRRPRTFISRHAIAPLILLLTLVLVMAGCSGTPSNPELIMASTTSTGDSGLMDALIPIFEEETGYTIKPIYVGSGAAMTMGERGEADVLLVHAPASEVAFMQAGHGTNRKLVMHNDFVFVGPAADPAGIKGTASAVEALKKIAAAGAIFISRGDDSGTHKMELSLWTKASIESEGQTWYQESGQGMGATLTIASEKDAYTLTDRATYLATQENLSLDILVEGDPVLLNIYHVIQINPNKSDKINADGAEAFADFMVSDEAQEIIRTFGVEEFGQPLFFPDAGKTEADLGSV
ncbi:MAG: substrate-binding domain-containing protein [Dehalococcoidales bacterium]|nr:substrate-binding domain-containing protein [Dehalococcoidales bacterium]